MGHSAPSNAKVKNDWSYTSTPPIFLHGVDSDNLNFSPYFIRQMDWKYLVNFYNNHLDSLQIHYVQCNLQHGKTKNED
jgi:hypothetical protein